MTHLPPPELIKKRTEVAPDKIDFKPQPREFLPGLKFYVDAFYRVRPFRLLFLCVMFFLIVSWLVDMVKPMLHEIRPAHTMHRVAAGAFLLAVIVNFIVEFGWRGGCGNGGLSMKSDRHPREKL